MHHMRLKKALETFQPKIDAGATPDEITVELQKEEYGYTEEEQAEILKALHAENAGNGETGTPPEAGTQGAPPPPASVAPVGSSNPGNSEGPKAPRFDYNNLTGEEFKKYMNHIASLNGNDKRTFKLMRVEVIKKVRYKGIKDSPVDVIGVRIKDSKPIITTLIPVKAATVQNGFIREDEDGEFFELLGSQVETNQRFYLLQ